MKQLSILLLTFLCFSGIAYAQEICDNAIDDDGDGLIDLNDDDCECVYLGIGESLIPNPSFEDTLCCTPGFGNFDCVENWIQANSTSADHYIACDGETFPYGWGVGPPPFPFPSEGVACVGFHSTEFIGACLETPMIAGDSYSLSFYVASYDLDEPYDMALYGTPVCADLPFVGACPTDSGEWEELVIQTVNPVLGGEWVEVIFSYTPTVNLEAIAIGAPCGSPLPSYRYLDELILLSDFATFGIETTGGWCSEDLVLTAETDTFGGYWQWYKEGIALIGETSAELNAIPYGEGEFNAVYTIGSYCFTLSYFTPYINLTSNFAAASICFPGTSEFLNLSEVGEGSGWIGYEWDFGDGTVSDEINPTHTYPMAGDYDVTLIVNSADSTCADTIVQPYSIYPIPFTEMEIVSEGMFTYVGNPTVCANNAVMFSTITDLPPGYDVVTWFWDFGDGTTSTEANPVHFYSDYGVYEIYLSVESGPGCSYSLTETIFVTQLFPNFTVEDECVFDEVNFINTSSAISPSVLESYEWHFDDGSTLTTTDADYTYTAPGTYPVELVVTSTSGCKDTVEQFVEVHPLPLAALEFIVDGVSSYDGGTGGCYTSSVQFNDSSTIDLPSVIDSWLWDFGDGTTSTEQYPEHLYYSEGTYTVSLTVSSNFGCEESITTDIIMTNGLVALTPDTTICQNGTATLLAESSDGGAYSYDWSIIGADDSPNQTLTGLTTSQWVYVTATNAAGCISPMDSVLIDVYDPITATITPADTVCLGDPATINTVASGGNEVYNYSWTVDGDLIGEASATLTAYPTTTTEYCVTIADGCESDPVMICTDVFVPELPVFIADNTQGCVPTEILFTDLTGPADFTEQF